MARIVADRAHSWDTVDYEGDRSIMLTLDAVLLELCPALVKIGR